jgi:hypothetical protein
MQQPKNAASPYPEAAEAPARLAPAEGAAKIARCAKTRALYKKVTKHVTSATRTPYDRTNEVTDSPGRRDCRRAVSGWY